MRFVLGFVVVVRVLAQPLVGESLTAVPIASGSGSLHPTAQELVITNDTDYTNFFGGTPPASFYREFLGGGRARGDHGQLASRIVERTGKITKLVE